MPLLQSVKRRRKRGVGNEGGRQKQGQGFERVNALNLSRVT